MVLCDISLVSIALLLALFFLLRLAFEEIAYKIQAIKRQYKDGVFKGIISADITLSLLFVSYGFMNQYGTFYLSISFQCGCYFHLLDVQHGTAKRL
ncbi:hypothetical protein [Ruminiclostridium josui]|uniref:hypothetical protein n=1 Tax=Ruminiclostridium josui TaxID=1499 RepID=UPI0006CF691C|nr:hypothetical protein [Ruminiclostridium josui]